MAFDTLVRDAYLPRRDDVCDIAIDGDEIARVAAEIDPGDAAVIDANGNVVTPGFVDSHLHVDKAYSARGDRRPQYNERGLDMANLRQNGLDHYMGSTSAELTANAVELGIQAAENGTQYIRGHVNLGNGIGTKVVESMLEARRILKDVVNLELVLFPDAGILNDADAERLIRESLDMGADLVGGADPATKNGNPRAAIDTWFDIAADEDADIDIHLHNAGTLGLYELLQLCETSIERDFEGHVTASHSFGLAHAAEHGTSDHDIPDHSGGEMKGLPSFEAVLDTISGADLSVVSCYHNCKPQMPFRKLLNRDIALGWGSDNVYDYVVRHAQPNPLLGAHVNAFKLDPAYHTYASNDGLALIWDTITHAGAKIQDLGTDYGIHEGAPANLVVLDEPSPQWAIINLATPRYVVRDGDIIVEDGSLCVNPLADESIYL
jgi:cytosine/adenosine deaminase-related metal-dependent hydrolase